MTFSQYLSAIGDRITGSKYMFDLTQYGHLKVK